MRRILLLAVILVLVWPQVPQGSAQAVTLPYLYDDFNTKPINPFRWWVNVVEPGFNGYRDMLVEHVNGRLKMEFASYGNYGWPDATNTLPSGRVILAMTPEFMNVQGVQFKVRIEDVALTGCGAPNPSRADVRFIGQMFRDGLSPAPPSDPWAQDYDQTNVFWVMIRLRTRLDWPKKVFRVQYTVWKNLDPAGDESVELGFWSQTFQDVAVGQDVTFGVETDTVNHRFIFTKDNEPMQTVHYGGYLASTENFTWRDGDIKQLEARIYMETCDPPHRARGRIKVTFDDVRTQTQSDHPNRPYLEQFR